MLESTRAGFYLLVHVPVRKVKIQTQAQGSTHGHHGWNCQFCPVPLVWDTRFWPVQALPAGPNLLSPHQDRFYVGLTPFPQPIQAVHLNAVLMTGLSRDSQVMKPQLPQPNPPEPLPLALCWTSKRQRE